MSGYNDLRFHRKLVADRQRSGAYRAAIHGAVRPGQAVLEIGTGSGLLAFFACQAGAHKVYAVDSAEIIGVARKLAAANGLEDRIVFIKGDIRTIELPEQVDVIISELITMFVIGERMEELVGLCRDRFLKPGGRLVPENVELWMAPVQQATEWEKIPFPAAAVYDLDFASVDPALFNGLRSARFQPQELLAEPARAYLYDAYSATANQHPDAVVRFVATRPGVLHGFAAWFNSRLFGETDLSTFPPGLPSWDNAFFPLPEPVSVAAGSRIELRLKGIHPPGADPVWQWQTTVREPAAKGESVLARHSQSSFEGTLLSKDRLLRHSEKFQPELSETGRAAAAVLAWSDGGVAVATMAERLRGEHPGLFSDPAAAKEFVQRVVWSFQTAGYVL